MPKVGGKHFSYGAKGVAAAKREAAATGKPMTNTKPAAAGSKSAPSAKANPMAAARSHGQQGTAMKAAHAAPKATMPAGNPSMANKRTAAAKRSAAKPTPMPMKGKRARPV